MRVGNVDIDRSLIEPEDFHGLISNTIARAVGIEQALEVIESCSLMKLYINENPKPDSHASQLLGHTAHCALAKFYGSEAICMPNAEETLMRIRNKIICKEAKRFTNEEIARKYKITIRWVIHIKNIGQQQEELNEPPAEKKELQYSLI